MLPEAGVTNLMQIRGKRILVTGATGFIGGRVVERLIIEHGVQVTALVNQFMNASRLARFPVRMIGGSIVDTAAVASAAEDCDAIVHCAVSHSSGDLGNRQIAVEGTRNICAIAQSRRLRLVHLSTVSVYGLPPTDHLEEGTPKVPRTDDFYAINKLESEHVVQDYQSRGLIATILQPTIVYGPFSFWSQFASNNVASGLLALPDAGAGVCNAVYVDDVVDSIFLSLSADQPPPGPFLINGPDIITWRDFFLGHSVGKSMPSILAIDPARLIENAVAKPKLTLIQSLLGPKFMFYLKSMLKELPGVNATVVATKRRLGIQSPAPWAPPPRMPPGQVEPLEPTPDLWPLLRWRTAVNCAAAQNALGFRPRFTFAAGTALTKSWLEWCHPNTHDALSNDKPHRTRS